MPESVEAFIVRLIAQGDPKLPERIAYMMRESLIRSGNVGAERDRIARYVADNALDNSLTEQVLSAIREAH